jgi:hypothetical protein
MREEPIIDPCQPSPCGPYSQCRKINNVAVCSCMTNYIGSPPNCRPECMHSSDCNADKSCISQKCRDPCHGTCGINARCQVVNHNPICSCSPSYTGDPFIRCIQKEDRPAIEDYSDPCVPSPCGPNSQCRHIDGQGVCSCLSDYLGSPPNCRPECVLNHECPSSLTCKNMKCQDPCPGLCGTNAICLVVNHYAICQCQNQYTGDPFSQCTPIPSKTKSVFF